MGWFDTNKYSPVQHYISKEDIKQIARHVHATSSNVTKLEEEVVECLVTEGRHGDGKISLKQIWTILSRLHREGKLSEPDRKRLMDAFVEWFGHKFGAT